MKSFTKEEKSWIMYDWADSVFATIMIAAVFPQFFVSMAGGEGSQGSLWWAVGVSTSRFLLGILAPFIGALIAYKGFKKRVLNITIIGGVISTFSIAFFGTWPMLLIGYIIANMFFSASNFVYDSYLPDVTTPERMDKVSAWGYGMGYIGGSTIPFLVSIALILFGSNFGIDAEMAVRISIIITAVWWGIFSFPIILHVHHKYEKDAVDGKILKKSIKLTIETAKKIRKNKGILIFIIAYFFYIDGVGTIINMAVAYGAELGLGTEGMIAALFLTQLVAFPFSILFGKLAKIMNSINLIISAICIYLVITITGFIMGFGLEEYWFDENFATMLFWIMAFMVGMVQGGIQAISRSTYGRLIPKEEAGEYFGFFEIFGRFAAILGPGIYAVVLSVTARPSFGVISVSILFLIGLIILIFGKKHILISK